ncbi:MAG TPA: class I adenylate-forming enzyme family protein [Jatrophihabitantaceae bacterium]|jgi:acyl-CoA synthetase (AMP-forming)/AMP-acid ligase II|nr:class I adenylate-forming enzyme family protein [Jatrophihabitantaceae bacterium]
MPLSMLIEMAVDAWPDRVAVGAASGGLTFRELYDAARNGAETLVGTGARSVAYLDVNGPQFAVALWSAALAGLPFCPLNYRMSGEQLEPLVAALDSPVLITGSAYDSGVTSDAVAKFDSEAFAAEARRPAGHTPAPVEDDRTAIVLFTSGTTSAPKAVLLRHQNLVSYVLETVDFGAAEDGDSILVSMPPYHVAGVNSALTNLYSGRRMVHLPNFDQRRWLDVVKAESITHAMLVPTMLARIVDQLDGATADVPSLRNLAYGGARMPGPVLERALEAFPGVGFVNAYGLTETSSTIAVLGPDEHRTAITSADPSVRERLGSVGRLVPGIQAQVRDESGQAVAEGAGGELWLRGPQISGEYMGKGSVLDAGGWFPTRDRARIDAEGFLFIEGRLDDTIIRGGENIAPAEIEEVLARLDGVADVAVVGRPDDEWGERIVAAIVPRSGASLSAIEVREFVRAHLRSSRTPDDVVMLPELPYGPTGKLVRRDLLAQLEGAEPG